MAEQQKKSGQEQEPGQETVVAAGTKAAQGPVTQVPLAQAAAEQAAVWVQVTQSQADRLLAAQEAAEQAAAEQGTPGPDIADQVEIWIVTGQSGAGKTNALRVLEDWGFFCIDNLPPALLAKTVQLIREAGDIRQLALGVDVRSRRFFGSLMPALAEMEGICGRPKILFLGADTATLVKRFKETRRRHPLASEGMLLEDIQEERKRLEALRDLADIFIDTSSLRPKELKDILEQRISRGQNKDRFQAHLVSFGFKHGLPWDADLVMDVRFLPNPFYIPELNPLTGLDEPVREYVMGHEVSQGFFDQFLKMLLYLIPHYIQEGKSSLVVAIGCTGGQHRSVTLAELLGQALRAEGVLVGVSHRDVERGKGGC